MKWREFFSSKKSPEAGPHIGDPYQSKLDAESKKWGRHLQVEASGDWSAWLDHPLILKHYQDLGQVEGREWEEWVPVYLGGPAQASFDLGCGAGARSIKVWEKGATLRVEGLDISEDRVAAGERQLRSRQIPGSLKVGDINNLKLKTNSYDLIFSCHSFHHFFKLEHIMEQVSQALTPRGVFILEEFVGPTQFQWSDQQIDLVRSMLALVPPYLRRYRWNNLKIMEDRPTVEQVIAESPFESIRSADIYPLFQRYFEIVAVRPLGGTLQHLLYNGIIHNFRPDDEQACNCIEALIAVEDALISSDLLSSDFMLLIGRRKD